MRLPILRERSYPRLMLLVALAVLFSAVVAVAAQLFTMDAASFRQRGGLVYLEVYFMIQRDRLKFEQAIDGYEARYSITVELNTPDTVLSTTSWEMVDRALQLEDITPRQKLPDVIVYNLLPGPYKLKATVTDQNQNATYTRSLDLKLQTYPGDSLSVSDIELATKLQKGEEGSKFYKNGFLVIPNPERIYGTSLPMMYYYAEIYNLKHPGGQFSVDRLILDDSQKEVKSLPTKTHKKVGSSAVEVDGFSVASLESGTYFLKLVARDEDTDQESDAEAKFFVYRPGDFTQQAPLAEQGAPTADDLQFQSYTEEELDRAIDELKYLVSDADLHSAQRLNTEGKRAFLIRFWKEQDPNLATEVNEFRITFEKRKEYAEQKFSLLGREGWKTDRGRVYILYGPPDDVEYHTHDIDTRSYEIWYYDTIEGGVQFVFVDRNNFGDYRLVHSTKKGELYRPGWYEEEALVRRP